MKNATWLLLPVIVALVVGFVAGLQVRPGDRFVFPGCDYSQDTTEASGVFTISREWHCAIADTKLGQVHYGKATELFTLLKGEGPAIYHMPSLRADTVSK